jgi:XTP/dITP diphosphohydrolase
VFAADAGTGILKLVLASGNRGKQREFQTLLAAAGVELVLQSELGIASVPETGETFEANALIKSRHAAACARLPALSDDSGLEVDALGGRPGVRSARYAGESATDEQNNALLLQQLARIPTDLRTARYRCVLALTRSADDPAPIIAVGNWEGCIGHSPAGEGGFGYDPLFIPDGCSCTAAQLSPQLKNTLSHRARALGALLDALQA